MKGRIVSPVALAVALYAPFASAIPAQNADDAATQNADATATQNDAEAWTTARSAGRIERLAVEHVQGRTVVHSNGTALGSATSSEPFHLADRTRLYMRIENVTHAPADLAGALPHEGLIGISAEQRDAAVQLAIDAAAIGDYGVEHREDGLALWIEDTPVAAAPLDATEPLGTTQALRPAASARHPMALRVVAAASATASAAGQSLGQLATAAGRATAHAARVSANRPTWRLAAAGLLVFLVLPIVAWRFIAARLRPADASEAPSTRLTSDRPSVRMGDARLWAARTFAAEGLDAAEIAERTGLSRDAAALLVLGTHAAKAAAPGRNFRSAAPSARPAGAGSHGVDH